MHVILWIIFGLLVGLVARAIMPGPKPHGLIMTTLLGIVGGVVGGVIGQAVGVYPQSALGAFIMAVAGAVVVLFIYHLVVPTRYRI